MKKQNGVQLSKLIHDLGFEVEYLPKPAEEIFVYSTDINRPGLAITGFFDYFDEERIQVMGKSEHSYLKKLSSDERMASLDAFLSRRPPVIIVTKSLAFFTELRECCEKYQVPLLRSHETTSPTAAAIISFLNVELAPRMTQHGVLVEVYGEGVLIVGESGIGKSEAAVELVKRGHRLIADDAVEIRRVSSKTLVGSAPDNIRYFLELRGVGVINARRIFGMGAIKDTEKIDMVIEMENWNPEKVYDRMGNGDDTMEILGNHVPKTTIPIKPGRNIAMIIEVAAMNNRQKKMGYNATEELVHQLGLDQE